MTLSQSAITSYHRLGGLGGFNNKHLHLTVLEAGSPRSGCQRGPVLMRSSSELQTADFSLYPHMVERERVRELSGVPKGTNKDTNPIHEG